MVGIFGRFVCGRVCRIDTDAEPQHRRACSNARVNVPACRGGAQATARCNNASCPRRPKCGSYFYATYVDL